MTTIQEFAKQQRRNFEQEESAKEMDGGSIAGMSVRDHFAIKVLPSIYSNSTYGNNRAAQVAYELADAMLEARKCKP